MFSGNTLRRICGVASLVFLCTGLGCSQTLVNIDGFNSNGSGRAVSDLRVSQKGTSPTSATLAGKGLLTEDNFFAGRGLDIIKNGNITYRVNDDVMTSLSLAHKQNTDIGTTSTEFSIGLGENETSASILFSSFGGWQPFIRWNKDKYSFEMLPGRLDLGAGDLFVDYVEAGAFQGGDFRGDGSGLTGITLNQLSDVTVTTPANGQVLTYNGSQWVNSAITGYVPTSRTISTASPLTGGGDLSANRTISIPKATSFADGYLSSADWSLFDGKVSPTRNVNTGLGLTGGGNLSSDRTIAIDTAVVPQLGVNNTFAGSNSFANEITVYDDGDTPKILFDGGGVFLFDASVPYFSFNDAVYATSFNGNGSGLTGINASNIASGTIDNVRLPTTAQKFSGEVTIPTSDNIAELTSIPMSAGDTVVVSYKGASNGGGPLWADTDTVGGWYVLATNAVSANTTIVWRVLKN